ncbi:hypothetical protein M405DRAFT_804957 [Rhizopogon salebrosus TDB-379]|nr:hypothetical protein M405DRAFT_804957 [Rhizopogon salebrosus TDB-379]
MSMRLPGSDHPDGSIGALITKLAQGSLLHGALDFVATLVAACLSFEITCGVSHSFVDRF